MIVDALGEPALAQVMDQGPRIRAFRANLLRMPVADLVAELRAAGIGFAAHPLSEWSFTTDVAGEYALKGSAAYREGRLYCQSLASQLPALVPPIGPGDAITEGCSAPGGKTTLLAMRVASPESAQSGRVIALERARVRFDKLRHTLRLLGAESVVRAYCCDARFPPGEALRPPARHVLLDPPCTGSGLVRGDDPRSWESLTQDYEGYVASRAQIQGSLLSTWAARLPPGGTLTYATCSIDPREDEAIIAPFLDRGFTLADLSAWRTRFQAARPGLSAFRGQRYPSAMERALRLDPSVECEGFFVAQLVRPG